jgi:hypothetical protein
MSKLLHPLLLLVATPIRKVMPVIAPAPQPRRVPEWHAAFLAMVPTIIRFTKTSFRGLDAETREDLVQDVVANSVVAFAHFVELGKQSIT